MTVFTPPAIRTAPVLPALAVGFALLAWASAFVVIRGAAEEFSPGALALGRLLIGSLVLGALLLPRGWVRPTGRQWALVTVFGVGWFGIYSVAINAAEQTLDAGTTALLVNIGPILIAVLAGLLLGEGLSRWLVTGIGVAFAGVVLIGLATGGGEGDVTGVLLCVVAAVCYAVSVVAQKPALRGLPALQVTCTACAIGAACCLPFAGVLADDIAGATPASVVGMLYLGAVPTALAFSAWGYALARMDAGKIGVTTYLVPPLVIALSWLLLDEVPPDLAIVGGVLCLGGVALSRRRSRPRPPAPVTRHPGSARSGRGAGHRGWSFRSDRSGRSEVGAGVDR